MGEQNGAIKVIFLQFVDINDCVNNLKSQTQDIETRSDCQTILKGMLCFELIIATNVWYEILLHVNNINK